MSTIEAQKLGRYHAHRRDSLNPWAIETKVLVPMIPARMEQASECASVVERADVTALIQVTKQTCQCEVVTFGRSRMLLANNVIDLKAYISVALEDEAILTPLLSTGNYEPTQLSADVGVTHVRLKFLP